MGNEVEYAPLVTCITVKSSDVQKIMFWLLVTLASKICCMNRNTDQLDNGNKSFQLFIQRSMKGAE